ncbi:hypothetical protein AXF42_Ash006316 [Apostasia shenzhenica]|uniref:Uncharacterized protein n=1 Tax=Apostasia shenzhenica TaxID=1088818 RepID=A0A2I0AYQ5_9ASPA|nr:hypothetical protein AXF42_Ash006316 [Apostasia shenzhenica]
MAPGIAIADPRIGKLNIGNRRSPTSETAADELRRRNLELEEQVREGRRKEEEMRRELDRTKERLRAAEEAEERICSELGELEAEAMAQAKKYNRRIKALSDCLAEAHKIISGADAVGGGSEAGRIRFMADVVPRQGTAPATVRR